MNRPATKLAAPARERGFSLVELMVVLVILAVGILPIAYVQTRAQQEVLDSGRDSQALAVAHTVMETAKTRGFGNNVDANGTVNSYQWAQTITNPSAGLEQITVTVVWTERGLARRASITSMIAER